jgi:putative acetyltransferase
MIIRPAKKKDELSITKVTIEAFKNLPVSNQTEHFIINALRLADVLTISLVAEMDNKIVGHIAFSPVEISDKTQDWYGLGPVSVLPEYQGNGIGTKLINKGLDLLKEKNGNGCVLVGNPNYYRRFGFKNYNELIHEGIPQKFFVALPFKNFIPRGTVKFHDGFWVKK